ncbi:essential MCU regulator, mitochondrial [Drosophila sechellia]|uniref:Essential MCU regulator, mitochondrial n=2 Tax=melanogaster subgroup TaxID=32351 RepID=B4HY17_DROSE|nr:essential MCU regulator, mitochondrial [Drosophila sechellia]XP_033170791.1 essential MCU regulator, mitochondrial [Drosophila mauritiana]EDW51947.1 GM16267 [Drosophila sechellia]
MPFSGDNFKDFKEINKIPKENNKYKYIAVLITVIPGIILGGYMGKKLAQFLEVFDLYAPDVSEDD